MARCPELEMGKNSATPCTRPSRKEEKAFIFHILLSFQITFCLFLSDYSGLYSFQKYGYICTIAHSGGNYQCNLRPGEKISPGQAGRKKKADAGVRPDLYPNNKMHHQMAPMTDTTSPSRSMMPRARSVAWSFSELS